LPARHECAADAFALVAQSSKVFRQIRVRLDFGLTIQRNCRFPNRPRMQALWESGLTKIAGTAEIRLVISAAEEAVLCPDAGANHRFDMPTEFLGESPQPRLLLGPAPIGAVGRELFGALSPFGCLQ
jgi:hypothetical protein